MRRYVKLLAIGSLIVLNCVAISGAATVTTQPKMGTQPATAGTPPAGAHQAVPNVTSPAVGRVPTIGNTTGSKLLVGPTPDLTAVANAISMRSKSLTILVMVNAGLKLTNPVTISIGYDGPRNTQSYVASTGNRFLYNDPLGDGKQRRRSVSITLSQDKPGGGIYTFDLPWWADLDPLYNVRIFPLTFAVPDGCGRSGDVGVRFQWHTPEGFVAQSAFLTSTGKTVSIGDFAWARGEVSGSANLFTPAVGSWEYSPGVIPGRIENSTTPLVPPRDTSKLNSVIAGTLRETNGLCQANFEYATTYTVLWCPYLDSPGTGCSAQ